MTGRRFDPDLDHRRSIRVPGHDYARGGAVFITICTYQRQSILGEVERGTVQLSEIGRIVQECWLAIPEHFPGVGADAYVVMPNHLHGILLLAGQTPGNQRMPPGPARASIGAIAGAFKSAASRRVNELHAADREPLWQRNYFEHVISDAAELTATRAYIEANPANWTSDEFYPLLSTARPRTP